jgi:hypothetical protein
MTTISTEWAVWIQGMDDVLPTLGRRDAFERAHKANTAAVWNETHPIRGVSDAYRPLVWAVPCQYGPDSPAGEQCGYPADWTVGQVEEAWREWGGE